MRSISAAFESRADAESAREQLAGLGVARAEIHILEQRARNDRAHHEGRTHARAWEHVKRMFWPVTHKAHEQAIHPSVFVLTAAVNVALVAAAGIALERSNAIELDQHEKQWRRNIWRGSAPASAAIDEHRRAAARISARSPGNRAADNEQCAGAELSDIGASETIADAQLLKGEKHRG